jgi:hypothetical protein
MANSRTPFYDDALLFLLTLWSRSHLYSKRVIDVETFSFADAHRDDGNRFIVRADEKLTAFVELERAIHAFAVELIS